MSESEIPFDVLADAAADGVILIDDQSTILFVNPAAGQIFGYEPAEMVGKNLTHLMPERHRQNYLTSLKGYFETGQSHIPKGSAPLKGLHKSGHEFPVEVSWAEHTSHGKRFLTGFVRDVTDRKRMEQLRERRVRHAAMNQEIHAAFASRAHSGLQSILQASAEAVVHHLDAAFARIWMLNDRESLLELQASAGQYTRLNGEFARMQIGERHVGFVAQQRKPYIVHDLVNDARTEHREWAKKEGIIALAGYPLLVEGHLVGVLALFARQTLGSDTLEALASGPIPSLRVPSASRPKRSSLRTRDSWRRPNSSHTSAAGAGTSRPVPSPGRKSFTVFLGGIKMHSAPLTRHSWISSTRTTAHSSKELSTTA
jgi:two-component system, NtrC family, sensor kinase